MYKTISAFLFAALMVGVAVCASAGVGPTDVAAWYKFDEGAGTAAEDSGPNNNDGLLENGATFSTDVDTSRDYVTSPSCVSFNHTANPDNRVRVPASTTLNAGTGSISICFFLKVAGDGATQQKAEFVTKGSTVKDEVAGATGNRYQIYEKDGSLIIVIDEDEPDLKMQYLTSAGPIYTGEWVHVAGVVDRTLSEAHLYADGVELSGYGATIWPTGSIDDPLDLYIGNTYPESEGAKYYPESFTGLIDDVRIYMRVLTQSEIQDICALPPTPTPTPTMTPTPSPAGALRWEIFD